jgi:hypothetical protein
MKALYQSIRTRLESQVTAIKYVRLFNDQFNKSNNDNPDQNIQEAFPYPCAFIEFPNDNPQVSAGVGAKRLDVLVRIKIGFESYKLEDLAMFDLATLVQIALEGYKDTMYSPLTYVAQRMDYDHDNVYIYEFDFRTTYSDDTKYALKDLVETPGPFASEIIGNLDIDNIVIRTGNGVV